jgi:hypothetical protein
MCIIAQQFDPVDALPSWLISVDICVCVYSEVPDVLHFLPLKSSLAVTGPTLPVSVSPLGYRLLNASENKPLGILEFWGFHT